MALWFSDFAHSQRQMLRRRSALVALAVATLASGCGLYGIDAPTGARPGGTAAPGDPSQSGQAMLQIATVPEDVQCIRITAAGTGRSEEREVDAVAGAMLTETLTGLPLGSVKFTGEAFAAACTSVSKSTIAAWASEPVTASIVLGRLANVSLVMARNGRAKVEIGFNDEAACTPLGAVCRLASECCSKRCLGQTCVTPSDAGSD
jgi:hypothetical protein